MRARTQFPTCTEIDNMACQSAVDGDCLFGDDLDAVLELLDEEIKSADFDEEINVLLEEIDSAAPVEGCFCEIFVTKIIFLKVRASDET